MEIKRFVSNELQANCYLLSFDNYCVVIDPCVNFDVLNKYLKDASPNLNIKYCLITHGHYDHILCLKSYLNKGICFYMHHNCMDKITTPSLNCSKLSGRNVLFDLTNETVCYVTDGLYRLEESHFVVLESFGHSNCEVTYVFDDAMFTGDFIFKNSIGRTDLPTSSKIHMYTSIERIKELSCDYAIYPGHGDKTSLFDELKYNRYLK